MKYTNLGNTGLSVSRLCLGMMTYGSKQWRDWVLEYDQARPFVAKALEAGINFFDTADVYSNGVSEEVLGRALTDLKVDRDDVVIATKCFGGTHNRKRNRWGLSAKNILASCDASLERLDTDYIDLYQIHRFDPHTPIEETIDALDSLVRSGKVRYIGASSMYAWQMAKYLFTQDARGCMRFVSMQNHYNLMYREEEREMNPLCVDQGIGLIPWSPLARGYLARTKDTLKDTVRSKSDEFTTMLYRRDADFDIVGRNAEVASNLGVKPAQTALAWLLSRPGVTAPIIGASKLTQLEDAIAAVEVELGTDEVKALEALYQPHAVAGHS
ncbi:MAG: aldo/keto reductase [Gammaproteobacteria bacterium]|nr:aldo/keto reductase [Gammaproteobacteria bacterium]